MSTPSRQNQAKRIVSSAVTKLIDSPWLKKIGLPLLFAWVYYLLTLVPVSQNLMKCGNCSPLKTSGNQKLWLNNIIGGKANETLFEYIGEPGQAITIHFDKARLDGNTVNLLGHFLPNIPKNPQPIDFRTIQNKNSKLFIKVILHKPTVTPNALYFSRELTPNKTQPDFKMKAEALELAIEVAQISSNQNTAANDKADLAIGNWHHKLSGIQVTILPEHSTDIAFRFDLAGWEPNKPFESFFIPGINNETHGEITAQGLGTLAATEGNPTIDNLLCAAPTGEKILWLGSNNFRTGDCPAGEPLTPLKLTAFKIGKETVEFSVSGHAWAKINGELTSNFITLVENNPVLKQILGKVKQLFGL